LRAARVRIVGALGIVAVGCGREMQSVIGPDARAEPASVLPTSSAQDPALRPGASLLPRADAIGFASSTDGGTSTAAGSAAPSASSAAARTPGDPANKTRPPLTSEDLEERAAQLLDAVMRNDPPSADAFFFPKAPFIPLKDVADPGRYFDQLLATYHRDIRTLHAQRNDWTGAAFVSFELGTAPTWVAPGKEYNRIGYFRTFGGKLRYRIGDKTKEMIVSTIISWDGRWYVTHLLPMRH
jgi:hypothetical protein